MLITASWFCILYDERNCVHMSSVQIVCVCAGTMTSSMTHWQSATVLLHTQERMAFRLVLISTQPMAPTPSLHWDTAHMGELITR